MKERITISDLIEAKRQNRKIAAVSCYDYTTAKLVSQTDVEMILVGDSAAQLMLGFDSTLPATMDFMVTITAAVRRGAPNAFLVADMPFLSCQVGLAEAVKNAGRFMSQAGAQMVKIEANRPHLDAIKAVSDAGIAVMGHIGITPQSISKTGRFKAEGTTARQAAEVIQLAEQVIDHGAAALLIEGTAAEVAELITRRCDAPVISCGAGPNCDGQILIAPDILGLTQGPSPKFARSFDHLAERSIEAFNAYAKHVHQGTFPDSEHSYHIKPGELEQLHDLLGGGFKCLK
ncbi:MAG: 3-methyl-2-oxobutanoate hydroxymethyltransferase [Planctomycetes bacterium RBG_16_55_9]|nr:MAG: 3-methyl-2-oxobutanoate hydroxymethyltransferase [Planctomycetes bacterium RBG_16_55_9]